ncbi:hypothetical protein HanRHA438_Chr10g0475271 [Helianthus annuus]|nr:hypothetical protein HanRHA438_Chr10g0475271 [Helianthus annuus]
MLKLSKEHDPKSWLRNPPIDIHVNSFFFLLFIMHACFSFVLVFLLNYEPFSVTYFFWYIYYYFCS